MDRKLFEKYIDSAKRIVIKIGSAVLTNDRGLEKELIFDLCSQTAALMKEGRQVVIVSSGAVAAGMTKMPEKAFGRTIPEKQALAAIGQGLLMQVYEEAFSRHAYKVAQILLTRDGLVPRRRYVNAKNTIKTLIDWTVVPIINENDTVATEELQFTDNDALSVLVVNLAEADLLVCLSDIDGLYAKDPRIHPDAEKIKVVKEIDSKILAMAGDSPGRAGRGGMASKIRAASMVTSFGVPMVIAGGKEPNVIANLFGGKSDCTLFLPAKKKRILGRKPWIAYALERKGVVRIDDGAVRALVQNGKSLLPAGIVQVSGEFNEGDCIVCVDSKGNEVALGLSNYSAEELKKISGCHSSQICAKIGRNSAKEEVIHRDNMVTLQ
ncbi:MAG: glutamate 5-kinase [Thermodesulfobacteria bacterium]|nr:glutamate 5-kinase [Thermodesulfobacteriota bacterium]